MSLQTLSKEILAGAKKQGEQCKFATQEQIAKLQEEYEQAFLAFKKKQEDLFSQEQELTEKHILGTHHLQAKELIRAAQKKLLEEISTTVLTSLQEDAGERKNTLLKKLVTLVKEEITIAQIHAPKIDTTLLKKIVPNSVQIQTCKEDVITFFAKGEKQSVSFSYKELITQAIEQQEKEIYEELF